MQITLDVNGESRTADVDEDTPLLWVLRESLALTGTKFGCGIAACGACTVHVNGTAVRSCSVPASAMQGQKITTIEGLAPKEQPHPLRQAGLERKVLGNQSHRQGADDINDEGAVWKCGTGIARGQNVNTVPQGGADAAAEKDDQEPH